jgi:hypothetical protein
MEMSTAKFLDTLGDVEAVEASGFFGMGLKRPNLGFQG